jgi:hypothetical protein
MWRIILTAGFVMAVAPVGILPERVEGANVPRRGLQLAAQHKSELEIVADFQARVAKYVTLHRQLETMLPTPTAAKTWEQAQAAVRALAAQIGAGRRGAQRGDLFTPEIERWFRQRVNQCLEGCDVDQLIAQINEEMPKSVVLGLRINGPWPEGASLGPMPPQLLAGLPILPEELQYRVIDRTLVLWDVHADIVVDFIRNAIR